MIRKIRKSFYKRRYHFPNGYGASVIRGPYTYGGEEGLFELAVLRGDSLCYDSGITEDVIGHLAPKDVVRILKQIRGLRPFYKRRYHFPNGYGASVIRQTHTSGGANGLFELAVIKNNTVCCDSGIASKVVQNLTPKGVVKFLRRIRELPLAKNS